MYNTDDLGCWIKNCKQSCSFAFTLNKDLSLWLRRRGPTVRTMPTCKQMQYGVVTDCGAIEHLPDLGHWGLDSDLFGSGFEK